MSWPESFSGDIGYPNPADTASAPWAPSPHGGSQTYLNPTPGPSQLNPGASQPTGTPLSQMPPMMDAPPGQQPPMTVPGPPPSTAPFGLPPQGPTDRQATPGQKGVGGPPDNTGKPPLEEEPKEPKEKIPLHKKAWGLVVKKFDESTPAHLYLMPCSLQAFMVGVMVLAFVLGFVFNVLNSTSWCSEENGCITCTVLSTTSLGETGRDDFSEGCKVIPKSFLEFNLDECSAGQVTNSESTINVLTQTNLNELRTRLVAICEKSLTRKCPYGAGATMQGEQIGATRAQETGSISNAKGLPPDGCFGLKFPCKTFDGQVVWANATYNSSCAAINEMAFSKLVQADLLAKVVHYNEEKQLIGLDQAKLHKQYEDYSHKISNDFFFAEIMRLMSLKCWVDQLYDEIVNPSKYKETWHTLEQIGPAVGVASVKVTVPHFAKTRSEEGSASRHLTADPTPPPGAGEGPPPGGGGGGGGGSGGGGITWVDEIKPYLIIQPSRYSSNCGSGGLKTTIQPAGGRIYALGIGPADPRLGADSPSSMTFEAIGLDTCGVGCTKGLAQVDPLTGSERCCARPGWTVIASNGYAFALLLLSIAGLAVAGFIALVKGLPYVDMEALKSGMAENASSANPL